jgi:hypothetical protein
MAEVLRLLKARLILPMHFFGEVTLSRFLALMGESFPVERSPGLSVTVSAATLPGSPKILVLQGFDLISPD